MGNSNGLATLEDGGLIFKYACLERSGLRIHLCNLRLDMLLHVVHVPDALVHSRRVLNSFVHEARDLLLRRGEGCLGVRGDRADVEANRSGLERGHVLDVLDLRVGETMGCHCGCLRMSGAR